MNAARKVFLRYVANHIIVLLAPLAITAAYYRISLGVIQRDVEAIAATQLQGSMVRIERLLADIERMSIQLSNDYEVAYYLNSRGPLAGMELYNLKRISQKLFSYVLGSGALSHCLLYMDRSGFVVSEAGFSPYEEFYGTLFHAEGYTAEQWREQVVRSDRAEGFLPQQVLVVGGARATCAVYRRPIGYGSYNLGTILWIMERGALDGMLGELPRKYGGWVWAEDAKGRVVCSTNPDLDEVRRIRAEAPTAERLRHEGEIYRLYRLRSRSTGWCYAALLSETRLFAGVRTVRNTAFGLLAVGLVAGVAISYVLASRSSRPLGKLFELALGEQQGAQGGRAASVYEQLEQAITVVSASRRRLESEARNAERITRIYFFQNLLRGNYRSRRDFEEDRRLFGVEFSRPPYYVILARLAALNAAAGDAYERLRGALLEAAAARIGGGEFVVPFSFDDVALIKSRDVSRPHRQDALAFLESLRAGMDLAIRGDFAFGVGTAVEDPFLLIVSHNEAAAALAHVGAEGREPVLFYEDLPRVKSSYCYPLDLEEDIMKAVRSGNTELLDSLITVVREENFVRRRLPAADVRDLLVELRGTAMRLLEELAEGGSGLAEDLARWGREAQGPEALEELRRILGRLAASYGQRKRSHNSALLEALRSYVATQFARPELSLTLIADTFGMSKNYLSNFFKEQTGECLSAAIQRLRFEEAARLLRETDETIDAVASRCGYLNTSSFRRAFKRASGLSPSEYRSERLCARHPLALGSDPAQPPDPGGAR